MNKRATREEKVAIDTLKALAAQWPKTLWLFASGGSLHVMRLGNAGEQVFTPGIDGGVDPAYIVETIPMPIDGGDW